IQLRTNDFGAGVTYIWRFPNGTNFPTTSNELNIQNLFQDLSGVFTVRVVRNGCTSLPSEGREITVTAFPAIILGVTDPVCAGQEINFQVTDLAGATYSWQGPNNFSSSIPNPTIASADAGVHNGQYSVVTQLGGCVSDTLRADVNVLPSPRSPVAQPITSICLSDPGAVLQLRVNPNTDSEGAVYQWYIQNGQTPVGEATVDLLQEITDFSLFEGGGLFDFSVRAIVGGCESELSTPVMVRLDAAAGVAADAGQDTIICAGLHLLEAEPVPTGSGRWTLVQGTGDITIVNPGSPTTAVQGLTEFGGPYQFAWSLSNGSCRDYAADTVMLTVTDGEAAFAGENIVACIREETRLNAGVPSQVGSGGRWSQGLAQEILGVEIENPLDPQTVITGLQPDNVYSFTWTVTSNCGVKEDNVLVNVSDPSPDGGGDLTVCNLDRTAALVAAPPTLGSVGLWRALDEGLSIADPESASTTVSGLQAGDNRVIWEVDEGICGDRSRDTVTIFYAEPPQPRDDAVDTDFQAPVTFNPTDNDELPPGSVVSIPVLPAEGGELFDNGDGTFTYLPPANFVGEIAIQYLVASESCTNARAFVFVRIGKDVNCEAPNIFTPNNDGMNDTFVVPCLLDRDRFPESQVTIYNQWGDEVYRSGVPYQNDWDGTYQGSSLPVGTYFYIVDFGGTRDSESGDVRIER
ncbi:MAG: gliding motility-associated C-terminal domain-containing protein, partial [Bacteroidota bacterium]